MWLTVIFITHIIKMGNDVTGGFLYETSYAKECAEALKIHVLTFRRLEKDPSQFTIEQAKKLCEFLEVEFDVMFFN